MLNPTRTGVRFAHAVRRTVRLSHNIHKVAVRLAVPTFSSGGATDYGQRTQRNAFYRISGWVEAAAPAQVVVPASGWYTATSPQGDPVGLLGFGYPRPLDTARLVQGDDIAHPSRVGDASMVDKDGDA